MAPSQYLNKIIIRKKEDIGGFKDLVAFSNDVFNYRITILF
jgi:hypothetical protein